ncbi:hypothetical protein NC652_035924 [Populus alba x Populus x berolinensis]|nr:hypothetical protein NC652_035924 [Populus alba x Populus x berolinensis]
MVDGWCKADWIDCALKIFDSMDTRDSFSHSSLIHNLCKDGRFRCASKLLLSCVRSGMSILPSTKHAVFDSLSRSGCQRDLNQKLNWLFQHSFRCTVEVGKVERISCALFVSSHPVSDTTEVSLNPFMYISRASTSAMIDGTAFHNLCHWSCNIPQVLQATT